MTYPYQMQFGKYRPVCLIYAVIVIFCSACATVPSSSSRLSSNFPAKMAIAAFGQGQSSLETGNAKLDPKMKLQCMLESSDSEEVNGNELLSEINLLDEQTSFTEDQTLEAVRLIKTGQFFADIYSAVQVSSRLFPGIRERVRVRLINPRRLTCAPSALSTNPAVSVDPFSEILACIYQNPVAGEVAETASILLQNDSIRLATIVYARANGINLNETDLDALRDNALNAENPDLDALAMQGIDRLKAQYGVDEIEQLTQHIRDKRNLCEVDQSDELSATSGDAHTNIDL